MRKVDLQVTPVPGLSEIMPTLPSLGLVSSIVSQLLEQLRHLSKQRRFFAIIIYLL